MKNPIIVLTGPTGSGKTSLSIKLAKKFGGIIINGDSVTVYRGMNVGTAKPVFDKLKVKKPALSDSRMGKKLIKLDEKLVDGISHFLFDIRNPDEEYNAAMYVADVKKIIAENPTQRPIFIVGGSMLYIDAFVYNYDFSKKGRPIAKKPQNILYLAIDVPREKLYQTIDRRFDEMIGEGLLEEVRRLYEKYDGTKSLGSAGYKQLAEHLKGNVSLAEAIEKAKQAHRNFAKRQLTWFCHNNDIIWIKDLKEAEQEIRKFLS